MTLVCAILAVIVVAASFYAVRQMFPSAGTVKDAAICTALRIAVTYGDRAIEQGDMSASDRAQARRGIQEMRTQYQRDCGPLP